MTDNGDKLYDGITAEKWDKELAVNRFWNRKHLFALWSLMGTHSTMLDIGCGLGDLVQMSRKLGIEAYGVDQLVTDAVTEDRWKWNQDWFFHHDLRQPFSLGQFAGVSVVNLVLCWEVAEHIPDNNIDVFCDTICNHLERETNSILAFTAAHPGQGGTEHVSGRPAIFWRDQFHSRGLTFLEEKTARLALMWSNIGSPLWWLASNLMIFEK